MLRSQVQFTDNGWGGYGSITNQQLSFNFLAPNMTNETAIATTQAWHNYSTSLASLGVVFTDQIIYSPSYYVVYLAATSSASQNGDNLLITNRLLSRDSIAANASRIADILIDCDAGFDMIAGGRVSQFSADSAGLNPAWRNAIVETVCGVGWADSTSSAEIQQLVTQLQGWIQSTYDVTPNDGAYFNEASPFGIEWQQAFFGAHYPTLKNIKDKYDPHRIFVVLEGVGSEEWSHDLTCRY